MGIKQSPPLGAGPVVELATGSRIITKNAGMLMMVLATANGATGLAYVYDGQNDQSPLLFTIKLAENVTLPIPFYYALPFDRGLYVKINEATTTIMFQYEPLPAGVVI